MSSHLPAVSFLSVLLLCLQVAFVGFAVQALASRTGPIEGLTKHLSNPGYNITYTLTHLQDVNTY